MYSRLYCQNCFLAQQSHKIFTLAVKACRCATLKPKSQYCQSTNNLHIILNALHITPVTVKQQFVYLMQLAQCTTMSTPEISDLCYSNKKVIRLFSSVSCPHQDHNPIVY